MAFRASAPSMAYDDYERYQRSGRGAAEPEAPEYPINLQFMLTSEDLEKAEADDGEPGDMMRFAAMGTVSSVTKDMDDCRIELELTEFAGDDGKFFDLSQPAHICLCGPELEKMELEADCERGDMIHLIGTVRLERTHDHEFDSGATLQIVELTFEDESSESRDGG